MIPALIMAIISATSNGPTVPACPASPNCVSSMAYDSHRIEPFIATGEPRTALGKIRSILAQRSDAAVIAADDTMIKVEFRTRLGFIDDALFLLDPAKGVIHLYSAARVGYWDLGKNRRRMEEIRAAYQAP